MKKAIFTSVSKLFFFCAAANLSNAATLEITLTGAIPKKGQIVLGLYNEEEKFPTQGRQFRQTKVVPENESVTITLTDVPAGSYAIAVFQDVNGNGELDKSILGKPKEPVGFSNNVQGKFGPPKYSPALIAVAEPKSATSIVLRK